MSNIVIINGVKVDLSAEDIATLERNRANSGSFQEPIYEDPLESMSWDFSQEPIFDGRDDNPAYQALSQEMNNQANVALCIQDMSNAGISPRTVTRSDLSKVIALCRKHEVNPKEFGLDVKTEDGRDMEFRPTVNHDAMNESIRKNNAGFDAVAAKILGGSSEYSQPIIESSAPLYRENALIESLGTSNTSLSMVDELEEDNFEDSLTNDILRLL